MSAEAALAICKAEWADARLRFCGALDPSTQKLIQATDEFLVSDYALEAFQGGWTMEELFGMGRGGDQTQGGLICAAAAGLEIVRFDGPRVWLRVGQEAGDHGLCYSRKDFSHSKIQPWWQGHVPLAN
jgi:hypothetical protein